MKRLSFASLRPHSPWLALLLSAIILVTSITLTVFVPFALLYLKEPLKLDYLWAALCLMGAVDLRDGLLSRGAP
jgi:hypothetical protein